MDIYMNRDMKRMRVVLSIAGSDSGAGAGIQADIKAVGAVGGYCATAITAITAQNTVGVEAVYPCSAEQVRAQIDAVARDMDIAVIKTGMLPSVEIIDEVCSAINRYNIESVVVDPVMVATSGDSLVGESQAEHLIKHLIPMATLVTPNIPEAERISGVKIVDDSCFDLVASRIASLGVNALLLKGGHLEADMISDMLYTFNSGKKLLFSHPKIVTENTHGTGCTLSSAIAGYLSQGESLEVSVRRAIEYLQGAIKAAVLWQIGMGHSPVKHL